MIIIYKHFSNKFPGCFTKLSCFIGYFTINSNCIIITDTAHISCPTVTAFIPIIIRIVFDIKLITFIIIKSRFTVSQKWEISHFSHVLKLPSTVTYILLFPGIQFPCKKPESITPFSVLALFATLYNSKSISRKTQNLPSFSKNLPLPLPPKD